MSDLFMERKLRWRGRHLVAGLLLSLAGLVALTGVVGAVSRRSDQWALDLLAAEFIHTDIDGTGVIVAVVDTDIAAGHVDLVGQVVPGYDFVEDRPFDPAATDRQLAVVDHGTVVAGIIAADSDGDGITGLAPGARIMPVRVVPDFQQGSTSILADGIRWAADNGADVINVSIRSRTDSANVRLAVDHAVSKGAIVVASGGLAEDGAEWYPAALSNVVAVGAVNEDLTLYSGSPTAGYIELAAPGASILSSAGRDLDSHIPGRGTSFAAPHVSGTIALMRQVAPNAGLAEVREALHSTAIDLGAPGRDDSFGHGLLDSVGAVMWIDRRDPEPPAVASLDKVGSDLLLGIERGPSFDVLSHEVSVDGQLILAANVDDTTVRVDLGGRTGRRVEVRSVDATGRTSEAFTVVSPPLAVELTAAKGSVVVEWEAPAQEGVVAYDVSLNGAVAVRVVHGGLVRHSTTIAVEAGASPGIAVAAIGPHGIVSRWIEAPRVQALNEADTPQAPGSLAATSTRDRIALNWNPAVGEVDRYVVERDGSVIANVSAEVTSFIDRTVNAGTAYTYRVAAEGPGGRSEPSPAALATTGGQADPTGSYAVVTSRGRVISGSLALPPAQVGHAVVSGVANPSGGGFWLVTAEGKVTAHGDAEWHGDVSELALVGPIVAMASTPHGDGYWLVGSDGGVFALGGASFYGSMGALDIDAPVVDISVTSSGRGYVLVGSDGGVFAFGSARFKGSASTFAGGRLVTAVAAGGSGYLVIGSDGGVFSFEEPFHGSIPALRSGGAKLPNASAVDIEVHPDGSGYLVMLTDGTVVGFGAIEQLGSVELANGERAVDLLYVP
ncbi:MAG: S8 family serine peptidase [Actinomycetia bacterium]|nr:S8 family serine peptidase [Actinomycetes bacterium]